MRAARALLPDEGFDAIVASPLARAWEGARIVWPNGAIRLESDFREIDFGDWEGLTAGEIEARDPAGYRLWQERLHEFAFPGGERRSDFRLRVRRGMQRLLATGFKSALVVVHHGVIRAVVEDLTGEELDRGVPTLGGLTMLVGSGERWERR
jgi:broad specificity phosphatase PhoE